MSKIFFKATVFVLFFLPQSGFAQIDNVWALGDGEKVFKYDINHPDKSKNFTWDGKTIRLKGLYNEVLAFQVVVQTGKLAAENIDIALNVPVNKESGKTIGGNTFKYGPSGTIEIFSEHYLNVKDSTHPNWFYGSPAAQPKQMTGWIPDCLVPIDALPGRGGLPIAIGPLQNQAFWIDVHCPRDTKTFTAGIYKGSVQILQNGKTVSEIPLEITLLPHYLTDENPQSVWLYASDVLDYYPGFTQQQVDDMLKFEGHRHRIDVVGEFDVNTKPFNEKAMEKYKPFIDGSGFTPANNYNGNGEGIGEKIFPIGIYGIPVMGLVKDTVQQQANLWVNWFNKNAPQVKYFWYITDEPTEEKYAWVREHAGWIKSNPGIGKALPVFTTTNYTPALLGSIDIWSGYDGVDLKTLPEIKRTGGDHWFYNGNRPRYGAVILEGAAVDQRVDAWIQYKYGIFNRFIWEGTHWRHNGQGPKRHTHQNIFKNPLTFINDDMAFGNGDGIVFYPGHMPFYPEEDRGLNRLLPSIRLKNIRRGQQDAAIMQMAEQKAGKQKVIDIINKVVPKALSEVSMKDTVPWSQKGDDYDKAMEAILKLL
jgi:hypothetical protein